MKFINGTNRHQVEIYTRCLDQTIEKDHEARTIDLFVDRIKPEEFGFDKQWSSSIPSGRFTSTIHLWIVEVNTFIS